MRPLTSLDRQSARPIVGVAFDVDDTVTTHGKLTVKALDALYRLHDAGIWLVAVTGRPSAFAEVLLGQWPLRAAIGETGGVAYFEKDGRPIEVLRASTAERIAHRRALDALVADVKSYVPQAKLSQDSKHRLTDVAWDIREFERLSEDDIAAVTARIRAHGARLTRSTVHLHATFSADEKGSGLVHLLSRVFGGDATAVRHTWAFIGDSANDASCFAGFHLTCGVANVASQLSRITIAPRYVTRAMHGAGLAEFATALLAAREPLE